MACYFSSVMVTVLLLLFCVTVVQCWPEGTFGLPMPKTGCPETSSFEWETGSRTQTTEEGSHSSENIHLAGVEIDKSSYIVQNFCMKMSYSVPTDYHWMPGKYCIFKKGECPANFDEGWIYWADNVALLFIPGQHQRFQGVLPDGKYDSHTKIFYCCRGDGSTLEPIRLPTVSPFYLFKYGDSCQEVSGMTVIEEWVKWMDDNMNYRDGSHPKLLRPGFGTAYTKLYYCYYQPKPPSEIIRYVLITIYVVAAIIGTLLIVYVIVCLVQFLARRRKKATSTEERADNSFNMVQTRTADVPATIYRHPPGYASVPTRDSERSERPVSNGSDVEKHKTDSYPPTYDEVMSEASFQT